jgi:hypothetical protein
MLALLVAVLHPLVAAHLLPQAEELALLQDKHRAVVKHLHKVDRLRHKLDKHLLLMMQTMTVKMTQQVKLFL